MSSISARAVGGDPSATAATNNPIRSDGELQVLMQKLGSIRKHDSFHRWKDKFLARLEDYLYEGGTAPARTSADKLEESLERLLGRANKVLNHIHEGQLSEERKTVRAALALQEMCNDLEGVRGNMASDLIPSFKSDERAMGYSKFHLGAVLIQQGFRQYSSMKAIEEAVTEIDSKLQNVADRQQHDLFAQYHTQVQRFCDVMADLDLYEVMLKCVQFRTPPGEDESEEPESIQVVLHFVEDGRKVPIDVDETETMPGIYALAGTAFGLGGRPLVIKHRGVNPDENDANVGKSLQQLGIEDEAVLDVELLLIPITVDNTWDDTQMELLVEPLLYITDLKRLLETKSGIPAAKQNLTFHDQPINDVTQRLSDHKAIAGSVLKLEPGSVKISVSTPDGKVYEIDVAPSDGIPAIKQKLEEAGGMVVARQVLKDTNGNVLPDDGSTVRSMGIRDGTNLVAEVYKVPIVVNSWDGGRYELMVDPIGTLSELKLELEEESEIPAHNQIISFDGEALSDDAQTLQDYGIKGGSELNLEPALVSMSVETPDGTIHEIHVSPSDDVNIIKQRVQEASGMEVNRQVVKDRDGNELSNDGSSVRDLGLRQGDKLAIDVFKVPVTVNSWDGQQYEMMVDPSEALLDFKQQLEGRTAIKADNQVLSLEGSVLQEDDRALQNYGVKSGSVIDLEPKIVNISVVTPDGVTHAIDVRPSDHSAIIKQKIESKAGVSVPRQVLKGGDGKEMPHDGTTVRELGIRDGCALSVDILKIPVKVRSWDGQEYDMMVDPTETLEELKRNLEEPSGIQAGNQSLCHDGNELQDDATTIHDLGVIANSVLDVEPKTIKVVIKTSSGNIEIGLSPSDNCQAIKQKIEDATGMAVARQVLKDENGLEIPQDGATVRDMGMRDGCSLIVEVLKIPILVRSWDGQEYKISVDPTEPLLELKKLLEGESGIPVDNQWVHFDEVELLDNAKTVQSYDIVAGSVIQLEPLGIKILVKTPDDVKYNIEVSPRDDENAVKHKIENVSGIIVPRQVLRHNGGEEVLRGGSTVADMGIKDGTELAVSIFTFPVTVKSWDGKQFDVQVDPTETLAELKRQCETESGIPMGNQSISHRTEALVEDDTSLQTHGIEANSILDLEPKGVALIVQTPDGASHEIIVSPAADSKAIKEAIHGKAGMSVPRQVLKDSTGSELPVDGSSLKEMGIHNGSKLTVEVFKIPVTVKSWDGTEFQILVDPTENLRSLKESLEPKSEILINNQTLHFGKTPLDNDTCTLDDYEVKAGSVLDLEPKSINVSVETPDGTYEIEILPSDDSAAIKLKIEEKSGIIVRRQILMDSSGKELPENGSTVKQMGIRNGDKLSVDIFKISVDIRCWDGAQHEVMAEPHELLSDLKEKLSDHFGIDPNNQSLFLGEDSLDDGTKTLQDCGIESGSVLNLEPKSVRVTVEAPDGTVYDVNVSPADDSLAIQHKFELVSGMAVSRQVLKDSDGIELPNDGSTIKDMGIKEGTTLSVEVFKVPILVNSWDNRQFDIMVDPTDKLSELKLQLEACSGILPPNQNLVFGIDPLEDDTKELNFFGIKAQSVFDLEPKTIEVSVTMPDGRAHIINVALADDEKAMKHKIEKETGIQISRQVLKDGTGTEFPQDGSTIKDINTRDGHSFSVEIFKIPVTVKDWDGSQYDLIVDPTETLSDLKEQLQAASSIPVNNQNIRFGDMPLLEDSTAIKEYGIEEGSTLYLEPLNVKLELIAPDGTKHEIKVSPSDGSNEIKQKVQDATNIAVPRQVLMHDGQELPSGGATIKDMGLRDGDSLSVGIYTIPVTVLSWDGVQHELTVDPSQNLVNFKHLVEEKTDIPAKNQTLSLEQEQLVEDTKTLQDYGVQAGSVLKLEPKLIKLMVTTPEGATHHIEVLLPDSVTAIKQAIEKETGIAIPRQVVLHKGAELPGNGSTVKDMGFRGGETLTVEICMIPIVVRSWDGTHCELSVDPSETLATLKEQVEGALGIPQSNQNLFFGEENLQDDSRALQEYGVKHGSALYVEPREIQVEVTTPDGATHTIAVSPMDDTHTIKKAIEAKSGITIPRQVLKYDGHELPGDDDVAATVKDMGIRDRSSICVEIFKIPVTVKSWDGNQYMLCVDPTETLSDFKKEVEVDSGIPASNQTLSLGGVLLEGESRPLQEHGIVAGCTVDLEPSTIKVVVATPDGATHDVYLSPSDDSNDIKKKIQDKTGMAIPRQVLKLNGKDLLQTAGSTVKDMGIREGSTLSVEIFKLPITIRTKSDGKIFKLMLDPTITTGDIKRYLEGKTNIPLRYQILSLGGTKFVDDARAAGSYGIVDGSILDLDRLDDPVVFVDVKYGTLFGLDRDQVIERGILTPTSQDSTNPYEYVEAIHDSREKDSLLKAMLGSPNLGVKPQIVVEKLEVEDYDLEEAENVKNKWGVQLKKTQKSKRGSEFIFVDIKTGHFGLLDRSSMMEKKFITPIGFGKAETLEEGEKDALRYDMYVKEIRRIFGVASL